MSEFPPTRPAPYSNPQRRDWRNGRPGPAACLFAARPAVRRTTCRRRRWCRCSRSCTAGQKTDVRPSSRKQPSTSSLIPITPDFIRSRNACAMRLGSDSPVNADASVRLGAKMSRCGRMGSSRSLDAGGLTVSRPIFTFGAARGSSSRTPGRSAVSAGRRPK